MNVLKGLSIDIPKNDLEKFDLRKQREIAETHRKVYETKEQILLSLMKLLIPHSLFRNPSTTLSYVIIHILIS